MTAPYPKRLIEVDLPIARISAHARREKSIRQGHISTLHIWWARRPLAACRAVICAALWPVSTSQLNGHHTRRVTGAAMRFVCIHVCVLSLAASRLAQAADWYVAADAGDEGRGTLQSPWTLPVALEGGRGESRVRPGDTIWIRGGVYRGAYTCYCAGKVNEPIVVRNYPGERVTLDSQGNKSSGLSVSTHATNVWIWGLEFKNSDHARVAKTRGERLRWNLVDLRGPNCKLLNCILHDGACGIGVWEAATNADVYGCLTYQNGWHRPDGDGGYGIYCQNRDRPDAPSQLRIRDVLCWNNYSFGLHGYAEEGRVENIISEGTCLSFGTASVDHQDLTLKNTYIAGSQCLALAGWKAAEISGNTFVARPATRLNGAQVTP